MIVSRRHNNRLRSPMVAITNTTQLNIFSTIQNIIISDSTLSSKFNSRNVVQFEPKHKSTNFFGFPYIWINVPSLSDTRLVFDENVRLKDLNIDIYLRMEYLAKDNYVNYCNSIIRAIESSKSTFESLGYYNPGIILVDTDSNQIINQKEIVEGIFELTCKGSVSR